MANDGNTVPAGQQIVDLARPMGNQQLAAEIDPLAIIEQRNKLLDRILAVAVVSTHAGQWTNLGGKPWPTGPAAESMARRCAVSITNISREKIASNDDKGPFYIWVYRATFSLPGGRDVLEAEGTCSSRDSFLGTETSAGRALSDIDEGSVMKAALTNCRVNGICQLLGLRNMTWERLESLGIKQGDVAEVKYDHGAKGGGGGKSSDDVELKFGQKHKGKRLSEIPDADVRWYIGCWEKDLADPEKAKYHAHSKRPTEIARAMLAARSAAQSGAAAPAGADAPAGGAPAGDAKPYDRILAIATTNKRSPDEARGWLKEHGRTTPAAVTNEDVAAFEKWAADVPF
jgi:hypothetical protein